MMALESSTGFGADGGGRWAQHGVRVVASWLRWARSGRSVRRRASDSRPVSYQSGGSGVDDDDAIGMVDGVAVDLTRPFDGSRVAVGEESAGSARADVGEVGSGGEVLGVRDGVCLPTWPGEGLPVVAGHAGHGVEEEEPVGHGEGPARPEEFEGVVEVVGLVGEPCVVVMRS